MAVTVVDTEAVIAEAIAEVAVAAAAKATALLPTLPTPLCPLALALPWKTRFTWHLPPLAPLLRS